MNNHNPPPEGQPGGPARQRQILEGIGWIPSGTSGGVCEGLLIYINRRLWTTPSAALARGFDSTPRVSKGRFGLRLPAAWRPPNSAGSRPVAFNRYWQSPQPCASWYAAITAAGIRPAALTCIPWSRAHALTTSA